MYLICKYKWPAWGGNEMGGSILTTMELLQEPWSLSSILGNVGFVGLAGWYAPGILKGFWVRNHDKIYTTAYIHLSKWLVLSTPYTRTQKSKGVFICTLCNYRVGTIPRRCWIVISLFGRHVCRESMLRSIQTLVIED